MVESGVEEGRGQEVAVVEGDVEVAVYSLHRFLIGS